MPRINMATVGRFGILKQTAFESIQAVDGSFHYFPFVNCGYGPVEGTAALPPEGSSHAMPGGLYKTGMAFQGTVDMVPRLDNRFGWILEATVGDSSTYDDQTVAQHIAAVGANVGVYAHQFLFESAAIGVAQGDQFELPYLTTHRYLPARATGEDVGEISQDACVTMLRLTVGATGLLMATVGLLGRGFTGTIWDINPGWTAPTLDDDDAFATGVNTNSTVMASITGGTPGTLTEFDVPACTLTFVNNLLPPAQARKIGTGFHIDHPNLGRAVMIECPYLVSDYDVYMQAFGGAASPVVDVGWSDAPVGGDIDITLQSSEEIAGAATTAYHLLRFRTTNANVRWSYRPLVLVPNQPVVLAMQGIITRVSGSEVPYELFLQNGTAAYA